MEVVGVGGGGMEPEAPFPLLEPGQVKVCWHRKPSGSHVSAAPVRLNVKEPPGSSERAHMSGGGEGGGGILADTVPPAMPAESLKLRPI